MAQTNRAAVEKAVATSTEADQAKSKPDTPVDADAAKAQEAKVSAEVEAALQAQREAFEREMADFRAEANARIAQARSEEPPRQRNSVLQTNTRVKSFDADGNLVTA
jgi:hypothetical protein